MENRYFCVAYMIYAQLLYRLESRPYVNNFDMVFLQGAKLQTRVGLLMLLSTWLADCSVAVTHFLSNSANVPYVSFRCMPFEIRKRSHGAVSKGWSQATYNDRIIPVFQKDINT